MEAVIQSELGFAVVEEKALKVSALRRLMDVVDREGPLIPRAMVPLVVDLSRQRIKVLIDEGRLPVVDVNGREMVPIAALNTFLADERKAGRPVQEFSMSESFRRNLLQSKK